MTRVKIPTSDGIIWNLQQVIADLIQASLSGPVTIDLLSEGPCCKTSGIDDLLNLIVDQYKVLPTIYSIETSNQIKTSDFAEIRQSFVELEYLQKQATMLPRSHSSLKKRFGFFVGRSNWIRLALGAYLYNNYQADTAMTYHFDVKSDFHLANFGLEALIKRHPLDIESAIKFIKKLPLKEGTYQYPILWDQGALNLEQYYQDTFCDIVCETYFSGRTFMMTEKTMRAIMHRRPFLVQGPLWYLENLKKLGFRTFAEWWPEGYDADPWEFKYQSLKRTIDYIGSQSQDTINSWYMEMQETLDHNYMVFQNLTPNLILNTEFSS